jgi:hypothetical protein
MNFPFVVILLLKLKTMYLLNHKFIGVIVIVISHGSLLCHHTSYNLQTSHEHFSRVMLGYLVRMEALRVIMT